MIQSIRYRDDGSVVGVTHHRDRRGDKTRITVFSDNLCNNCGESMGSETITVGRCRSCLPIRYRYGKQIMRSGWYPKGTIPVDDSEEIRKVWSR
jgi:hypothetical protein